MANLLRIAFPLLLLGVAGQGGASESLFRAHLPGRVQEYTSRVSQCIEWSVALNTGTSDPVRAAEVARAIQALDCKGLGAEANFLQKHIPPDSPEGEAVAVATKDWQNTVRSAHEK